MNDNTIPTPVYTTLHGEQPLPTFYDIDGNPVAPVFAPQAQAPVNPEKNGFGIAALICGIIGILFCIMPITGFIGFGLGVIAFIFGLAGWSRTRKNKATNKKTAIAGTATGLLAIVFGIIGIVVFFSAMNELGDGLDCISDAETTSQMDAC